MFICKRNNAGSVSLSSNWVESECFSDRTRCIWKDGALDGGMEGEAEGEAMVMKESSKRVCLPHFFKKKKGLGGSNYLCSTALA